MYLLIVLNISNVFLHHLFLKSHACAPTASPLSIDMLCHYTVEIWVFLIIVATLNTYPLPQKASFNDWLILDGLE